MKYEHQKTSGLLQKKCQFQNGSERESYDFRGWSLLYLGKFDSIWVVVDRLSKSGHFFLVRIDFNIEQLAYVCVKEIVRLHGVPLFVISDCGTQFSSKFWRKLHDELDTQLTFSTTFTMILEGIGISFYLCVSSFVIIFITSG